MFVAKGARESGEVEGFLGDVSRAQSDGTRERDEGVGRGVLSGLDWGERGGLPWWLAIELRIS